MAKSCSSNIKKATITAAGIFNEEKASCKVDNFTENDTGCSWTFFYKTESSIRSLKEKLADRLPHGVVFSVEENMDSPDSYEEYPRMGELRLEISVDKTSDAVEAGRSLPLWLGVLVILSFIALLLFTTLYDRFVRN